MATLLKHRARAPLAENALAAPGQTWSEGKQAYRLEILSSGHDYEILLSREEMLAVVAEWVAIEAREAARQARPHTAV
jgi:hypothetical protein